MSGKRLLVVLVFVGLVVSACTSGAGAGLPGGDGEGAQQPPHTATAQSDTAQEPVTDSGRDGSSDSSTSSEEDSQGKEASTCEDPFDGNTPSFTTSYWEKTNFCKHSVDYSSIFSGGPPPDGIPPIDDPSFVEISSADEWLENREPVISFQVGDAARAYPLQIMTWHEIVNDRVGGKPVVVTFCPLCNSALAFERPEIDGEILTFGTSGNLRHSDLVMYDRQTESWWQQFSGEAIVGDLTGTQLKFLPSSLISWEDFKSNHPDGKVLSRDTGYDRRYGSNPYVGYDDVDSSPFLFRGEVDDRLKPMARVLGLVDEEKEGISFSYSRLSQEKVIQTTYEGDPIVIFWKEGTASALDASSIPDGEDVGATAVFEAVIDGQQLTFDSNQDGTFTDKETGSTWTIAGEAVEGPMKGKSLASVPHVDTFWFAWAAFQGPESLVEQ